MERRVRTKAFCLIIELKSSALCLAVEFRYVADILPDVPLPRRAVSRKKHVVTRPRRLTSNYHL